MAKQKQNTSESNAYISLIVSLVALVATAILGLIKGLLTLELFTFEKEIVSQINLALWISGALFLVGLFMYAFMNPEGVRNFFTGRQARYGSNSLILTIAFVGIIGTVNYIVYKNPIKPWDMTESEQHTLAPETLQALATLPEKVTAKAFYSRNSPTDSAQKILNDFKANSKGKFDFDFVDPDLDPVSARAAGVTGDEKIVLFMGERKEVAAFASETELTRALVRLINPTPRAVYFLTGHGEGEITAGSSPSFSTASEMLTSKNYTVSSLNLLSTNKIPEDALAIIIAGPKKPISSQETALLKKYVDAGGSLVVMEDPIIYTDFGDAADPLAEYLKSDWGITLDNNVIIDLTSQQYLQAISATAGSHPITQNQKFVVIMPKTRSITLSNMEGISQTDLLSTAQQSWGEVNFTNKEGEKIGFDEGVDTPGPLNMAVAAENPATKGRVVVIGNSLFASDEGFDAYGNGDLFINSLDWAAEQENLINISPRTPKTRTFTPPSQGRQIAILLVAALCIPGLVIIGGISAWVSRRRRG